MKGMLAVSRSDLLSIPSTHPDQAKRNSYLFTIGVSDLEVLALF